MDTLKVMVEDTSPNVVKQVISTANSTFFRAALQFMCVSPLSVLLRACVCLCVCVYVCMRAYCF